MTLSESEFQKRIINELALRYPGAIILKNDPEYIQGIPDWLMLYGRTWAAFEIKKSENSRIQPNQEYYVDLLDEMSFARFIYPENEEKVFYELQRSLESGRITRFSVRK